MFVLGSIYKLLLYFVFYDIIWILNLNLNLNFYVYDFLFHDFKCWSKLAGHQIYQMKLPIMLIFIFFNEICKGTVYTS